LNSSQRMILNTAATYAGSVLAVGLMLFSSRWVLNALGQTDFGLFLLVGSIIVFITFLNTIMSSSAARHFAYAIGQGDPVEVNRWFNTALAIHLVFASGLILIGWPIGEYIIAHVLTVPVERVTSCLWVFRVSLVSAFISMISVPFVAMFTAQQRIAELSFWNTLRPVLVFTLAYTLTRISGDLLLIYAVGMVAIIVLIQSSLILRATFLFRECRIACGLMFNRQMSKEIFSFATWNMIGGFGGTLRGQGSAILLNIYFGPKANAAFGIANQVSAQTNQLAVAMLGALSPEITAREAGGERARMVNLSVRACKFGTILVMLFAIPLAVEMHYVLKIWLRHPPLHTALFCQLILCTFLIDRLSAGYLLAVLAHGKIAAYQLTVGTCLVLTLPVAWLFLHLGYPPTSVGAAFIIMITLCSFGRVLWARRLLGIPVRRWLNSVVLTCTIVAMAAIFAALAPSWMLPPSFLRLVLATIASFVTALLTTWFFALDSGERDFFRQNARHLLRRITGSGADAKSPAPSSTRSEDITP